MSYINRNRFYGSKLFLPLQFQHFKLIWNIISNSNCVLIIYSNFRIQFGYLNNFEEIKVFKKCEL